MNRTGSWTSAVCHTPAGVDHRFAWAEPDGLEHAVELADDRHPARQADHDLVAGVTLPVSHGRLASKIMTIRPSAPSSATASVQSSGTGASQSKPSTARARDPRLRWTGVAVRSMASRSSVTPVESRFARARIATLRAASGMPVRGWGCAANVRCLGGPAHRRPGGAVSNDRRRVASRRRSAASLRRVQAQLSSWASPMRMPSGPRT
jgi:hypothetical protein